MKLEDGKNWIQTHDKNFADNRYYDFAITDKTSGELYGCMGMAVDMNSNMGELGYWVGPAYWNRGIATEAARAMIEYGFKIKKLSLADKELIKDFFVNIFTTPIGIFILLEWYFCRFDINGRTLRAAF